MVGGDISYNSLQFLKTDFPNILDANGDYA